MNLPAKTPLALRIPARTWKIPIDRSPETCDRHERTYAHPRTSQLNIFVMYFCNIALFPAGGLQRRCQLYELFLNLSVELQPAVCAGGVKPNQLFER
jgi:hypothetical protein